MDTNEFDHALDTSKELRAVLDDLETRSRSFGAAITDSLKDAALYGDSLTEVLQSIATRFTSIALDAGLQPLQNALTSAFSGLTGSLGNSLGASAPAPAAAQAIAAAGAAQPNIVFNVQATDAQSCRRSETQINAMLVRAVGRGRRSV